MRQRMQLQTARLAAELDGLEVRLTEDRARVRLFSTLARRHRHVSALACRNAEWHVRSMQKLSERTVSRLRSVRRLAQAETGDLPGGRTR